MQEILAAKDYVGIISFPRSGNTWFRHIIARYLGVTDIRLVPDEHRNDVLKSVALQTKKGERRFYKSHDITGLKQQHSGVRVSEVIYLYRHPLDVFVSQLNFLTLNRDTWPFLLPLRTMEEIANRKEMHFYFGLFLLKGSLQPGASWDRHIETWLGGRSGRHVIPLRYEDMLADPLKSLAPVADYFGLDHEKLADALAQAQGATRKDGKFYWRQKSGTYRDFLTDAQIRKFELTHVGAMKLAGYL